MLIPHGVTQILLTEGLDDALDKHAEEVETNRQEIDKVEVPERFARHVGKVVALKLEAIESPEKRSKVVRQIMELLKHVDETPVHPPTELTAVLPKRSVNNRRLLGTRPQTPLNDAALLTNAKGDPSLISEIRSEIATADNVDLLCAFVKWSGLNLLESELRALTERGGKLRVITTTYIGATERRALDRLVEKLGAEVKIQYEINSTRLHAKSWYFHRNSGWDTAYVGSSNLSVPAMTEGVEWNVRLSRQQTGQLLSKFMRTFESYWADTSYQLYDPKVDKERLTSALAQASGKTQEESSVILGGLDVRPYPHQEEILEKLRVERSIHGNHRNLVVAATGTGKTVIAALDYRDNLSTPGRYPRLLFIAHRIEILKQAMRTYRAVLKEGDFGEILADSRQMHDWTHVFATIQSLSRNLGLISPDHFDVVVIDEFHHAEASTYRKVLQALNPTELLGLTATPERGDGVDVATFFDNRTAASIRLWDALETDLLCPFHYFGISDNTDLSALKWVRGKYDDNVLSEYYVNNDTRTALIIKQLDNKVSDPKSMRALGFCVSVQHAQYMATAFSKAGLPSLAVTGHSTSKERTDAIKRLRSGEIVAIFTVDLYNEGIDIPEVDTILFLRPTESATVFLQQLGRGLRKSAEKAVLTVLDFVGMQRQEFRFDQKFRALTGVTRRGLLEGVEKGFSYLPPGCDVSLDEASREVILENLKRQVSPKWKHVVSEYKQHLVDGASVSLLDFISESEYELSDILKRKRKGQDRNWTLLKRDAGVSIDNMGPLHNEMIRRSQALAHVDDPLRLSVYRKLLNGTLGSWSKLSAEHQRLATMLLFVVRPHGVTYTSPEHAIEILEAEPAACAEFLEVLEVAESRIEHLAKPMEGRLKNEVILTHARYTREEIVVGMRYAGFKPKPSPVSMQQGVFQAVDTSTDVLLVTLKKNEKNYSPTTMYRDAIISPSILHWESQSTTSIDSPTGRRYVNHKEKGSEVVIFARETENGELGVAAPYLCLGTADFVSAKGSRPIEIDWKLRTPIPADVVARMMLQ
jgi:type III restriction enzyme, res subunit